MKKIFKDQVVIITGATSGIGKGCVKVFGRAGAHIVATGRDRGKLDALEKQMEPEKISLITVLADAAKEEDNQKMVDEAIAHFGRIDALIANAGISMRAMFEELDIGVFKKVMDINFYGAVYAVQYALPHILQSKGHIVAMSSINGHRGTPARTAYTASKYAMEGFFEALRTEVMKRGVKVLVVSPGFTGTNIRNIALTADGKMQGESPRDEEKMMTPEQVAVATLRAMKSGRRDLVLTTQGKLVVWLNKFFPRMMDRIVYNHMAKEPDSPFN
jgi:short-subunit dehydrogenase